MDNPVSPILIGVAFAYCIVSIGAWCAYPSWKEKEIQRKVDEIERRGR